VNAIVEESTRIEVIAGEVTRIIQELARARRIAEVRPRDNLLAQGVVDSLAIVKLILVLEERFPIRITDEDIVPENFRDIESLSRFVQSKLR
jgi:acyl carrier protein